MPDGSSYGQIESSTCSARIRATPEEVREASLQWARDLGWILGRDADSLLVFRFSRFSRWFGGPEIEVFFEEQDGAVFVSFTASQAITVGLLVISAPESAPISRSVAPASTLSGSALIPTSTTANT
jgi:hypothetical protein